ALRDATHVKDIRNLGLVAGIELEPRDGAPGARGYEAFVKCFEAGVLVRFTGDILAFSPPLIVDEAQIAHIFDTVRNALATVQ
ncbi:MAG TPA: aminotransferase class III-fold pyridoxal phosphate-dependent enzyme, partial [Paraburkholderia sp.]